MIEGLVYIQDDFKEVCNRYMSIVQTEDVKYKKNTIICEDWCFQDKNGWCMMNLLRGDGIAEEILLELSNGNRLLYFFSDDVQLDCDFLVLDNNKILRKKNICFDLPQLDCDEGRLKVEEKREFLYWNDIDYFVDIAREDPNKLFEC